MEKMENNLKNRYIYAVTRHLPAKIKADVEKELDGLITEMAEERGATDDNALKAIFAELGDPEDLALKYHPSERHALISGTYFLMYKRIVFMVLPIVAVVLIALTVLRFLINETFHVDAGVVTFGTILYAIADILHPLFNVLALITIVFAVLDYKKVSLKEADFSDLPEISNSKVSVFWAIFGIVIAISATAFLLLFPQIAQAYFLETGWILFFDIDILRSFALPIILWTVIEIAVEIFSLIEGHYTTRLAIASTVSGIAQIAIAVVVFGNNAIINPDFASALYERGFTTQINLIILSILIGVILFETFDTVWTAFKAKR